MKKISFLMLIGLIGIFTSGCSSISENSYNISQLHNRMVNVENAIASQNILIEENKTEIDRLFERDDEISRSVFSLSKRSSTSPKYAKPSRTTRSVAPRIVKASTSSSGDSILSDKLTVDISISDVQIGLKNAGFYMGKIDGKPGPMTKEGVKKFQKANGLGVDGVIGNQTWSKLKDY